MNSAIYIGAVRHARLAPTPHAFRFPMAMLYLDLAELPESLEQHPLWGFDQRRPFSFRRADHLGDPQQPLDESVRELVAERTGMRPEGPVRLLAMPRTLGLGFRPVSFYFCLAPGADRVEAVVAEVDNTPWGERHCYVLAGPGRPDGGLELVTGKDFHVSPFLPMELRYRWRFDRPAEALGLSIECSNDEGRVFAASLELERRALSARELSRVSLRFPFQAGVVLAGIYWQALRLWRKGVPFHPHPRDRADPASALPPSASPASPRSNPVHEPLAAAHGDPR